MRLYFYFVLLGDNNIPRLLKFASLESHVDLLLLRGLTGVLLKNEKNG